MAHKKLSLPSCTVVIQRLLVFYSTAEAPCQLQAELYAACAWGLSAWKTHFRYGVSPAPHSSFEQRSNPEVQAAAASARCDERVGRKGGNLHQLWQLTRLSE